MEHRVENLVCMEQAVPKRRILRSDGWLYTVLLLFVIGVIVTTNWLCGAFNWPRGAVQLGLYALLLACGYCVYRYCLVAFRYLLTDRMLIVSRLVGSKEKPEAQAHLSDIERIRPYTEAEPETRGKTAAVYTGKRAETLCITFLENGARRTLLLSCSADFREKLIAQWKTSRK